MNVANWYRNGDLEAFRKFCIQNRKKLIAVKLITGSEIAKGILYKTTTSNHVRLLVSSFY